MDDKSKKPKKTERDDSSVVSSGVTPGGKTQKDTQPVISAGVAITPTPAAQIISAGIVSTPGGEVVINKKNYKISKIIARSTGEAEVYLVERESQKYVFKYYYPNFKPKDSILIQLKGVTHDDIIDLIDYGYYCNRFFEILEYAAGGSLMDVREDGTYKYIPIKDIKRLRQIVEETINAFNFCHSKGIIHRDIKPENIFFKNPDGTDVQIGDFGISSMLDEGLSKHMTGQARTEIYAAPELYQSIGGKTIIAKEVDYYALGITIIHIWSGEEPFKELSPHAIMKIKCDGKVDIPEDAPEELKTLIKGLITVEPSKRWGYNELRKWLKGEAVPVYYKVVEVKYGDFHFGVISGEDVVVNDPAELAKLLEKYPEQGKNHLYKGTITKWVEAVNQALYIEIRGIVEDEYPQDKDAGLTKAIYVLDPLKNYKTFAGVECNTAEEIGDAIEQEASYYRSCLTQNKNADLFLYFEARDAKDVADAFRKYAQAFNPERALNTIIFELQGKDKFKIGNTVFYKPEDLLAADDKIKDKLVQLFKNSDSKLSIWMENYQELKAGIDMWRKLNRQNNVTLSYAVEKGCPYHFFGDKAFNVDDFKNFFAKHLSAKNTLNELTTPGTAFIEEAEFWLKNYHSTNYVEILSDYLQKRISDIDMSLLVTLVEYLHRTKIDVDYYWEKIKSLVDNEYRKGTISDSLKQKQEDFLKQRKTELQMNYENKKKKIITALDGIRVYNFNVLSNDRMQIKQLIETTNGEITRAQSKWNIDSLDAIRGAMQLLANAEDNLKRLMDFRDNAEKETSRKKAARKQALEADVETLKKNILIFSSIITLFSFIYLFSTNKPNTVDTILIIGGLGGIIWLISVTKSWWWGGD